MEYYEGKAKDFLMQNDVFSMTCANLLFNNTIKLDRTKIEN